MHIKYLEMLNKEVITIFECVYLHKNNKIVAICNDGKINHFENED